MNEKMAEIDQDRSTVDEAFRRVDEVIMFAKSLARDEMSRSLAHVVRASAAARKKGVSTSHVDRLTEESSRALMDDDLERGYIATAGKEELEKTARPAQRGYDLIVLLSRLSGELRLPADGKVAQQLKETKRLFEAGLYDGARTSARACYREVEGRGGSARTPRAGGSERHASGDEAAGVDSAPNEAVLRRLRQVCGRARRHRRCPRQRKSRKLVDLANERIRSEIAQGRACCMGTAGEARKAW